MRIKGLHDIKTHSNLAREGRLISVARNLHRLGGGTGEGGSASDDWSVERHVYFKKKSANPRSTAKASLSQKVFLENKARLYQIGVIQDFLQEMSQAIAEGIPVAMQEFERLPNRLAELEKG